MDESLGKQRGMEKDDCRALELPVSPCGEVATATVPSEGPTPSPYVQTGTPSLHCDPSVARRCLSTPPAHSDVRVAPSLHSTPISHHPQVRQSGRPNVFDDDTNAETAHLPARHSTLPPNPCEHPRPATSVVGSRELHAYATAVNQGKRTSAERRSEDICCESSLILQDVDPSTGRLLTRHLCRSFLGGGGFGMVFECTDMISKATYACKVIEAPMRINGEICCPDEIAIHRLLNHPNILKYVRYFYTHKHTFVLLERCISENLKHILDRKRHFSEAEVRFIMRQLCSAVNYMHKHDFIHRDIKLGNIMVDYAGNVKLGDFGFAKRCLYPHGRVRGGCGTPHYVAPEILLSRKVGSDYGLEVDIWSLGVVFFNLAYGFQPFRSSDEESTYERIRIGDYTFPDHPSVSESCKSLIASMLSLDPALRPTAEQVLESPFLADPLCFAGCQLSHRSKPRQPSVFVSMSLFDPTYGSLFMLCCDGRSVPVMVFNDLTKMRISDGEDGKKMEVYYVDRTREEHGGSGYVDERYLFSMDRNSDVPQFDSNKLISCAAQKRLGIIRYLRPFTTKSLSDPRHLLIFTPHLLHQLRSSKKLYKGPSHPEGPLFVKEAVTYPLQELFKDHRAGNSSGVAMAARFSNGSYQVSFHLEEDSDPDFSPITGGGVHGPASEQEQWDLHVNVLCYSKSPTHAQIDITKDKEACMFTIFDVRTDAQYNSFGKTFFAAGSAATSGYKQAPTEVSLPHKLLKLIGELLSRVRCPSRLIECFVKPKVPDDVTVLDCCEGH